MQIDLSKVQWDTPAAPAAAPIDIDAVQWDTPAAPAAAPKKAGFLTQLGRGAASLADTTLGGVLPAAAQQIVYPLARLGNTPEGAQAATRQVVSAVEQPFGKAFGVTDTPEYQQEASRQVLDFIGQNFQKGAKWIAEKTGLPQPDVESYVGTAAIAAPTAVKPATKAIKSTVVPALQDAAAGTKLVFDKPLQARRERQSAEDYKRGAQIDAAKEAQRLKLALNPTDIDPKSVGAQTSAGIAGPRGEAAIEKANIPRVNEIARKEMGLPDTASLADPKSFSSARAAVAGPYREIESIPVIMADDATRKTLNGLRVDESLIGGEATAKSVNKLVDSALEKVDGGLSGKAFLDNVSNLRKSAKRIYNNPSASAKQLSLADANLAIANTLEGMIEGSIRNPKLVQDFRNARQQMARIYSYEAATDLNTGIVNPAKIARITAKDNSLTGDIASIGQIAGNFPSAFRVASESPWYSAPRLTRTGVGGAAGALIGSSVGGIPGGVIGTAIGAAAGEIGSGLMAKRIASPGYQSKLSVRDMRIPVNQLAASMQPIPQNRAVVPYQAPVEVLDEGQGPYRPNFVMQPNQYAPRATFVGPNTGGPAQLGAPSAQGTVNMLRTEDARRAAMSRTLGQQAETQQAAAEAATRQPTRGGTALDLDPVTGKLVPVDSTVRGATPDIQVIESTGKSLSGAADLLSSGKSPALMTAEQRIAWDKTKVDLAEIAPGMKALTDKAIADKIMDRAWVQETIVRAQQKARAFDDIAARATTERMRQDALIKREQMIDLLETLEDRFAKSRPVARGGQGPKTRAFQRNMLSPEQEIQNALIVR